MHSSSRTPSRMRASSTTPFVEGDDHIRFYAGATVRAPDGLPMGTLCVIDRSPRDLSDDGHAVLRDLAEIVERQLAARYLEATDPLTGLRNRRTLKMAGDLLFGLVDRTESMSTIVFFDADRFKSINDMHGHDAGDAALQ